MNTEPIKILLVDDDDVDAEMVVRGFTRARIDNEITIAENGAEALEILRKNGEDEFNRPFIILLDLNMPVMNGFEFLQHIRRDDMLRASIVFVLSTSKADSDMARSYDLNVAGYIVKSDVGPSFTNAVEMLDRYWTTVTLPQSVA